MDCMSYLLYCIVLLYSFLYSFERLLDGHLFLISTQNVFMYKLDCCSLCIPWKSTLTFDLLTWLSVYANQLLFVLATSGSVRTTGISDSVVCSAYS